MGTVYLLHFDRPLHHARHYLGFSDDLPARLADHQSGRGARLMEVIGQAGIGFTLARTWDGTRRLERRLKRRHASPRLCPLCRAQARPAAGPDPACVVAAGAARGRNAV